MNRSYPSKKALSQIDPEEFSRKIAIHEAGHAAAIYLGNKQKQLPPVFFQIYINVPIRSSPYPEDEMAPAHSGRRLDFPVNETGAVSDNKARTVSPNPANLPEFEGFKRAINTYELNACIQLPRCLHKSNTDWFAKVEDGRLIHTLPSSFDEAIRDFSELQKHTYQQAFEADIINLLTGPLAEANYVAMRDDELINPRLVNLNALRNYGGASDLDIVNEYIECYFPDKERRDKKVSELFIAAFNFIKTQSNWLAIMALADYILANHKNIIECEEIIAVLDSHFPVAGKGVRP